MSGRTLPSITGSSWVRAIVWGVACVLSLIVFTFKFLQPERVAEIEALNWLLVFLFFNVLWYEFRYRQNRKRGSLTQREFLEICGAAQRADPAAAVKLILYVTRGSEAERRLAGTALENIGKAVIGQLVVASEQHPEPGRTALRELAGRIAEQRFVDQAALVRWWHANRAECQRAETQRAQDAADRRRGVPVRRAGAAVRRDGAAVRDPSNDPVSHQSV